MTTVVEVDPSHIDCEANLFQSAFWARFKKMRGYDTQAFVIEHRGRRSPLVMVHRPCASDAVFGYVPHGPDIAIEEDRQGRFLETVAEKIRSRLPDRCWFLRFDLPWSSPYAEEFFHFPGRLERPEPRIREMRMNFGCRRWNLRKAPSDMQAPDTVIIDLSADPGRILDKMHKKTRYCVRSAFRRGVVVEHCGPEALALWHPMYLEMARRKGIEAEDDAYFHALFTTVERSAEPDIRLYLAFRDGEPLAGSLFAFHRRSAQATYLFSAASPAGRTHLAAYAVLWKAILDAKAFGCRWFDLFGIPPADAPDHPMHGLFRFKARFGGHICHLRGSWDYPFDEKRYPLLALSGVDPRLAGAKSGPGPKTAA